MKVRITLTQDQDPEVYTVQSLEGTCQLNIGQKVNRERVSNWCAMSAVTVKIVGATPEDESPEQLELLDQDPIVKQIKGSKKPGARKPGTVKGSALKALPEPKAEAVKAA